VQLSYVVFVGTIMLSRGDEQRVLDCVEDDLRLDALLLAQQLDGLIDRSHKNPLARSPLELQVRLFHLVEGKLDRLPSVCLQGDQAISARSQGTFPAARILDRLPQDRFDLLSCKPLEIPVF